MRRPLARAASCAALLLTIVSGGLAGHLHITYAQQARDSAIAAAVPTASQPGVTATRIGARPTTTPSPIGTRPARATARPTPSPTDPAVPTGARRPVATPNPHPGFGALPWAQGEYYAWTIAGRETTGMAWQLMTRSGHLWHDLSAQRVVAYGEPSTFTSSLAFDANTYRLRRHDGVEDQPASVLRATLFGPILDYTSYQSWGRAGCSVVRKRTVAMNTTAYGLMADLVRSTELRDGQKALYPVLDPYGALPIAGASYRVLDHETLGTILGRMPAVHVRFLEGSQPPLDVWYSADRRHIVLKWGTPGRFGATLTHYEAHSARGMLPVPTVVVPLQPKDLPCA